jgi:hypothetical protein
VDLNQQAAVVGLIDGRSRSHNTAVMFVTHQIFDFTDYSQSHAGCRIVGTFRERAGWNPRAVPAG